jgi:hypothetical protein
MTVRWQAADLAVVHAGAIVGSLGHDLFVLWIALVVTHAFAEAWLHVRRGFGCVCQGPMALMGGMIYEVGGGLRYRKALLVRPVEVDRSSIELLRVGRGRNLVRFRTTEGSVVFVNLTARDRRRLFEVIGSNAEPSGWFASRPLKLPARGPSGERCTLWVHRLGIPSPRRDPWWLLRWVGRWSVRIGRRDRRWQVDLLEGGPRPLARDQTVVASKVASGPDVVLPVAFDVLREHGAKLAEPA